MFSCCLTCCEANDTDLDSTTGIWSNKRDDYDLGEVIGVGGATVVHVAYCKPRKEKCAIKRIYQQSLKRNRPVEEIKAMNACDHENIITYYTSFEVKDEVWLVIKLSEKGSLSDMIKYKIKSEDCRCGVFDEVTVATVLKEVLKGLEYLHKSGQMHRDIKAGNILLSKDGTVQIADFGLSAWLKTDDLTQQESKYSFVGTLCWMAPEIMGRTTGYDYKADIWSFGITALEMVIGKAPYQKKHPMEIIMLTIEKDPPTLDSVSIVKDQYKKYGKTIRNMIAECLQKDPAKRPTATELLKHPFFKKAKGKHFLVQSLLMHAPSIELKAQTKYNSRRPSKPSGRLYRTDSGEWIWLADESEKLSLSDFSNKQDNFTSYIAPSMLAQNLHASTEQEPQNCSIACNSADINATPELEHAPLNILPNIPEDDAMHQVVSSISLMLECSPVGTRLLTSLECTLPVIPEQECIPENTSITPETEYMPERTFFVTQQQIITDEVSPLSSNRILNFVLKIKNQQKELKKIHFKFDAISDASIVIAAELVTSGLIDNKDLFLVASHLEDLTNNTDLKRITFQLNPDLVFSGVLNDANFAELYLTDEE